MYEILSSSQNSKSQFDPSPVDLVGKYRLNQFPGLVLNYDLIGRLILGKVSQVKVQ